MIIRPAKRTDTVREYYFSRKLKEVALLDARRRAEARPGIINLGIGAPDRMPPEPVIKALVTIAQVLLCFTEGLTAFPMIGKLNLKRSGPTV